MKLLGANAASRITGLQELPGRNNYFLGNDPRKWRPNIPTHAKVQYQNVYPGVDLVYYGNQRQLEFDFLVSPGADPRTIKLSLEGAGKPKIDAQGDLVLPIADGRTIRLRKPFVYQEAGGVRKEVAGGYVLTGPRQIGFQVGKHDVSRPLIIDPVLIYSTYLGGRDEERGFGIAVAADGNAYVTGETASTDFPTANALQPGLGGSFDVFVTKITPPLADLGVTMTATPNPATVGSPLTYRVTVSNGGPDPATGVTVTDTLPAGVTFVSATPSQGICSGTSAIACSLGSLASGVSATVTIVVVPTTAGTISNTAGVTGKEGDPNNANNAAVATTTVRSQAQSFAAFAAKLEIKLGPRASDDEFEIKATVTLGPGSDGIAPLTEDVTLQVGTFRTTIPAGSFKFKPAEPGHKDKRGKPAQLTFEGVLAGVSLEAKITLLDAKTFEFKAEGKGADLTGTVNPVTVAFTIGNDSGAATVTAEIK